MEMETLRRKLPGELVSQAMTKVVGQMGFICYYFCYLWRFSLQVLQSLLSNSLHFLRSPFHIHEFSRAVNNLSAF